MSTKMPHPIILIAIKYFELPQDVFQTAKVSKILMAIKSGKGAQYKGKSLDESNFLMISTQMTDVEESKLNTSDHLISNHSKDISHSTSNDIPGPSNIHEPDLNSSKDKKSKSNTTS